MGNNKAVRNIIIYASIMVAVLLLLLAFLNPGQREPEMTISEVVAAVKAGEVRSITIYEDRDEILISFVDTSKPRHTAIREGQDAFADYLLRQGLAPDKLPEITVERTNSAAGWLTSLGFILPSLFLVVVFLFLMRRVQRQGRPPGS